MAAAKPPLIRAAEPADIDVIHALVDALADYEKLARPAPDARVRLARDLFGEHPRLQCTLAEVEGKAVGYAFTLETYSSFLALPTLYLEDLFVLPENRSQGAGAALFRQVLSDAESRGCGRLEWTVLDWNQLAIDFYERFGAEYLREWRLYRIRL